MDLNTLLAFLREHGFVAACTNPGCSQPAEAQMLVNDAYEGEASRLICWSHGMDVIEEPPSNSLSVHLWPFESGVTVRG
jgi:hypothetical protein